MSLVGRSAPEPLAVIGATLLEWSSGQHETTGGDFDRLAYTRATARFLELMVALTNEDLVLLIEKTASGNLEAWGTLWAETVPRATRFISGLLSRPIDDPDVLDLASETFDRVRRAAGSFRAESAAVSWILGIAKNVVRERLRSDAHFAAAVDIDALEEEASEEDKARAEDLAPLVHQLIDEVEKAAPAQGRALRLELSNPSREGLHGSEAAAHRQNVRRALKKAQEIVDRDPTYERLRRWPGL